jgi:hypothetical protein
MRVCASSSLVPSFAVVLALAPHALFSAQEGQTIPSSNAIPSDDCPRLAEAGSLPKSSLLLHATIYSCLMQNTPRNSITERLFV